MSFKLDNLGWFYRGKMGQPDALPESLDHKFVYYILVTFTVVGFLAIFTRLVQFARLIFSLFVLPGRPVCPSVPVSAFHETNIVLSAPHIWPALQNMGTRHGSFGWHWQGICPSAVSRWLLHPSRVAHRQQARCSGSRDQVQIQYRHQNPGHGLRSQR